MAKVLDYNCFTMLCSFFCTIKWISYMCTYILTLLGFPPPHLFPTHLGHHRAQLPVVYSRFLLAIHCTHLLLMFSRSVVSDSFQPPGLQHTRLPCPSPSPGACSNSYPLSRWCHPTISSSLVPFSFCLQSFPESGSVPVSQFFASGGQSVGASASFSTCHSNEYSGLISFRIYWFDLFDVQRTFKSLLQHHCSKASILWHSYTWVY